MPKIFTIGFTQTSAEDFFECLSKAGVRKIIDVRLNNQSQLSGFAKRKDLQYFLSSVAGIGYEHELSLAPTSDLLDGYRQRKLTWGDYETAFTNLIRQRAIESTFDPATLDGACLLCSEHRPHRCHRRLVAEHFKSAWPNVEIEHLVPAGKGAK